MSEWERTSKKGCEARGGDLQSSTKESFKFEMVCKLIIYG